MVGSLCNKKTPPQQGSNLRVAGRTGLELPRTRYGHPKVPHTAHHSGLATKKDAERLYSPCAFRGSNPGLIYIKHAHFSLKPKACQHIVALWPNQRVKRIGLPRRCFGLVGKLKILCAWVVWCWPPAYPGRYV